MENDSGSDFISQWFMPESIARRPLTRRGTRATFAALFQGRTKMRIALVLCCLLSSAPALADGPPRPEHLESQTDLGFDLGDGRWQQRFQARVVLNDLDFENRYELHYGASWKPSRHMTLDMTLGYALADDGNDRNHAVVLGFWKELRYLPHDALRFRIEGLHRYVFGSGYRYDGYYSADWWVVGLHAYNRGQDAAAGFHFGSGPGLLPFRFDIRISFGLTAGMPERSACFYMSFDVR